MTNNGNVYCELHIMKKDIPWVIDNGEWHTVGMTYSGNDR